MGEIGRPKQLSKKYKNSTGNEGKKDALKYVGRGFIQLTGKGNYIDAGKDLHGDGNHYVKNPDLAADAEEAAKIAVWFWNKNVKPRVKDFTDTAAVTRAINGSMAPKLEIHKRHNIFGSYLASVKDYLSKTKKV
jgi:putative chitinase